MMKWLGDCWLGLCGVLVAMVVASCGGQDMQASSLNGDVSKPAEQGSSAELVATLAPAGTPGTANAR